jgi:hypothetical protein
MNTNDIIDLTSENREPPPVQMKQRQLPKSVLAGTSTNGTHNRIVPNHQALPVRPYMQPLPNARTLPPTLVNNGTVTAPQLPVPRQQHQYVVPNARMEFSMISSLEFTVKAEVGGKISPEVIVTFKRIKGSRFDWQSCKWIFPVTDHDNLLVALSTHHKHVVNAVPRNTLAAAQLKNQRDKQLRELTAASHDSRTIDGCEDGGSNGGAGTVIVAPTITKEQRTLLDLKGHVPDKVLHQLAPFQMEAVQFVLRNKGRALIADEMGLGAE